MLNSQGTDQEQKIQAIVSAEAQNQVPAPASPAAAEHHASTGLLKTAARHTVTSP